MNKALMTFLGGVLFALPSVAALPLPIVDYTFDELTAQGGVADLSGNQQDLTLGAGATITNFAAKGNALWFDGTQSAYSYLTMSAALKAAKSRTISFWMYRDNFPGTYFEEAYSDSDKNSAMPMLIAGLNTFNFRFNNGWMKADDHSRGGNNYQLVAWIGDGGKNTGLYFNIPKYPEVLLGKWAHVAYTVDVKDEQPGGGYIVDANIYVNGEKCYAGTDLVASNITSTTTYSYLGNNGVNAKRPCHGAIDEFRVYSSALSDAQVKEEFARTRGAHTCKLVAWYPLQEFSDPDGTGTFTSPDETDYGKAHGTALQCSSDTSVVDGPFPGTKALHFDGTFGTLAHQRIPFPMDELTFSAWVNISTNTSILRIAGQSANYPCIIQMGNFKANVIWDIASTKFQYQLIGYPTIQNFDNNGMTGKGNWQHMVLVERVKHSLDEEGDVRTGHLELYLNGELAATGKDAQLTHARNAQDVEMVLGNTSTSGSARPFEGDLSDVRLYEGAMTADEVRRLYRGAAAVDAGEDFTVAGAKAVLCGTVAAKSPRVVETGYAGEVGWSLVSAPAGGEGAAFARAGNPVCEVMLPVEGEYVFRLATHGFEGAEATDTVTVTRDDASGKTSGAPAVDIEAVVSNAAVAATLKNGLVRSWNFNGLVRKDEVSGSICGGTVNNWSKARIVEGLTGFGCGTYADVACSGMSMGLNAGEKVSSYGGGCQPENEWLTVSAWIRPESDYPNNWFAGVICHLPLTLSICYGKYYNPTVATGPIPGLSILQTGIKGYQAWLNFDLPAGAGTLAGKWSHVTALVNRWKTADCEFYLDGVKLTEDTTHRSVGNYGVYTEPAYSPFNGKPCGGRFANDSVVIGNTQNEIGGVNNTIFQSSNTTTKTVFSRHFPGAIDEVRLYSRKLTETEIRYLATHPDPNANAAPVVTAATVGDGGLIVSKDEAPASAHAADDGNPAGALTYEWVVLKGDAANVQFADRTARETQVTFLKKGDYTLCLKVSDGERVTYGEPKTVSVSANGMMLLVR